MNHRILAAIRSQPWAIMPEYLDVIEAFALRQFDADVVIEVAADGHEQRFATALAQMGERASGTQHAAFRDGVGSLPIFGPLIPRGTGPNASAPLVSLAALAADFRALEAAPDVKKILLVFDSPGGMVTDVNAFAQMIAGASKPVYGFVSGDCCSAAYWIGSQCRELSSDPTARLGNIGVMMGGSVQEAPDSEGRRGVNVISSNAPLKRVDLATEEGQASIRAMLDGIEEVFLQAVARGRKVPVSTVKQDFGQGAPMSAKQAKSAGLIDRIEANGLAGALSRLASPVRTATPRRAAAAHQLAHIRAQSLK